WGSGRATYAPMTGPRSRRRNARPADTSPGPRRWRRPPSRACGSSAPATPAGTARWPRRTALRSYPAAEEGGQPVGRARAGRGLDDRPEDGHAVRSTVGVEDLDPGSGEQLVGELRIQVGGVADGPGQIPAVGELVPRHHVHQVRPG